VSEKLPSREQALNYLRKVGCRNNLIQHCEAVTDLAVEIAEECRKRGLSVNLELVEIGGLLHDIGRSRTHSVHHAIVGADIARSLGLPEAVISVIERHVGGGISASEARKLGWPRGMYIPQTLEEKIVCYADKLIEGSRRVSIAKTIKHFSKELPPGAVARIERLHEEMLGFIGDCECLP
jgi:uncharacterized protein